MTPQSVVQVTCYSSPYLGNFLSGEIAFARALRERTGISTHLVLAHGARGRPWLEELDSAGVTWSFLPPRRSAWRRHVADTMTRRGAALVHTHFTAADLPTARAAHAAGVPCVWHIRTGFSGYPVRQRVKDHVKMRIVARRDVSRIIAVSPWLGELTARRGAPAAMIDVIPDAIIAARFDRLPDRLAARSRFGLDPDATVILALGWWPEVKGVDILLDALHHLPRRDVPVQALLVGESEMRSFVDQRYPRLPDWLRLSGFVEDAAWLFAAADIFVSASRHEGQSAAIGEALTCGLPVVMSDIPGVSGWFDAPGAWTFPSGAANALTERLLALLGLSEQERRRAGVQNRRWILDEYGVEPWCEKRLSVYEKMLGGFGETRSETG